MRELPRGTVTFLFTDIEGSTRLLHELGAERTRRRWRSTGACCARRSRATAASRSTRRATRSSSPSRRAPRRARGGCEEAQAALGPIRVRMGLHTGTPLLTEEGYVGVDVHRAARIAAAGHGGQVLVSRLDAPRCSRRDGAPRSRRAPAQGPERARADLPARRRRVPAAEDALPDEPAGPGDAVPRPRARARRGGELLARDDVRLLTLTGPGGTRQDAARARRRPQSSRRRYPDGVWWVAARRRRAIPSVVLETAAQALGGGAALAEHRRRPRAAAPARQLRARASTRPPSSRPCSRRCPQLRRARHEPRAAAGGGRARVPACRPLARERSRSRSSSRARRPRCRSSSRTRTSTSSARGSTTCRSRSSSRPRADRCSTPSSSSSGSGRRLDLLRGRPRRRGPAADAPRDDRVVLRAPDRRRAAAVRAARRLPGRLTLEAAEAVCEADVEPLAVAGRQEPRPPRRRGPLLHARDDPRVRRRAARRRRGGESSSAAAGVLPATRSRTRTSDYESIGPPAMRARPGRSATTSAPRSNGRRQPETRTCGLHVLRTLEMFWVTNDPVGAESGSMHCWREAPTSSGRRSTAHALRLRGATST